jgi:hypothetical protein
LILQAELGERFWQRKYHMEIFHRQKFGATLFQPFGSGQGLALGAGAVPARVICVTLVATLVTSFQMAAQRRGAAHLDIA